MRHPANLVLVMALVAEMLSGCSGGHGDRDQAASGSRTVTIKGSDTMVILAQRWAETFMRSHEGTTIQVSGGGSGTGIAALLNGTTDIANSSRPIKDRERRQIQQRSGHEVVETRVALDALAVYVHRDSPVRYLTIPQLAQMFRGQVTNWSEVGGPDRPIVLYSRENNSGTYAYFKEHVLDDADFARSAQTLPGTAAVINAVSRDPGGIGYGGIGYAEGVRTLAIAAGGGEAVEPSLENATSGAYPLSRFLYMYTAGAPSGAGAEFLAWVQTAEGQELVDQVGFYPLPRDARAAVNE